MTPTAMKISMCQPDTLNLPLGGCMPKIIKRTAAAQAAASRYPAFQVELPRIQGCKLSNLQAELSGNCIQFILAASTPAVSSSLLGHRRVSLSIAAGAVVLAQRSSRSPFSVCPDRCSLAVGCGIPAIVHHLHRESLYDFSVLQKTGVWIFDEERHTVVSNKIQDLLDQLVGSNQVPGGLCFGSRSGVVRARRRSPDCVDLRWQHSRGEVQNVHVQICLCLGIKVDRKDIPAFMPEGSAD